MADKIGKRCEFGGHFGTVRYFGEVITTSGFWYGIEWDEQRGKHDGSYQGEVYFSCREGHGSFVRPHKINFGRSISEAIERRYGDLSDDVDNDNMYLIGERNQRTSVDVVGFDKVKNSLKQLKKLHKISLESMCVCGTDSSNDSQSIGDMVPNVHHLDLSRNLLISWLDIRAIAMQLKNLQVLNISDNRLEDLNDAVTENLTIKSLKTIFVNRMAIDWNQIINLLYSLPNLIDLHACFNDIERLDSRDWGGVLSSIQLLNLEGNQLNWNEIMKLSTLNNLETLIVNNNKISKIQFSEKDIGFHSLRAISLSHNQISEWLSLNQLAHLNSLTTIKFKSNPLCEGESSFDIRHEIIARLMQVSIVNGSEVSARERKDAELLYMKKYSSLWRDHGGKESHTTMNLSHEFQQAHPRFIELVKTYGAPIASIKKSTTLKDNLISLRFQCLTLEDSKIFTKKVPITMTIQQLKILLQRLFKVKAFDQRLSYRDSKTGLEVDLDDNLKDLIFYSVSEGDTILTRF